MPLQNDPTHDSLEVQVTEPAIFLRVSERQCRRYNAPTDEGGPLSGALIRGVLTLTLANAVPISSIEVELEGRAVTTWVEGAGRSRLERSEKYTLYSTSTVLFMAVPGILSHDNDARRASSVAPLSRDGHRPSQRGWARHSINDDDDRSTLSSHGRIKDSPTNMLSSRMRSASVDSPGRYRNWRNGHRSNLHLRDNSLDTRGRRSQNQEPAPSYALADVGTTSRGGSVASPTALGNDLHSGAESELEAQPDLGSTARLDLTVAIHQTQASGPGSLPEINEENAMGESYVSTATSRNWSPERHVAVGADHDRRGRSPGLSFTTIAHVLGAIKERTARSLSPLSHRGVSLSRSMLTDHSERGRPPSTVKERSRSLAGADASEVTTDSSSCGTTLEGNSESIVTFQRGTYNYPFYFTLPRNVPPTTKSAHGSFTWRLNATVKRNNSGSWPSLMMAACKEVEVVYSPVDDEFGEISETSDDIQLQRTWNAQFEYKFSIPRNSFPLDETLSIQLEIRPLTGIKIYRIAVYLDELVEYFTRSGVRVRTETITRATLLQLQHSPLSYETNEPILPFTSSDIQSFRASPFYRLRQLSQDAECKEALHYAGPGPWSVKCDLRLPGAMQGFHASTPKVNSEGGTERSLKSNVRIDHLLKVLIRVEKGDEGVATGKKRLYDVFMHVPIRMLSNLCTAEWTALPKYSSPSLRLMESNPSSSHNRNTDCSQDRLSDPLDKRSNRGRESQGSLPFLPRSFPAENRSPARIDGASGYGELYERLVSGLESETGQAPPRYGECELQTRT